MKVYLDACVLSRLSDERRQARVAAEAEAIEAVFRLIYLGDVEWSASIALLREISRNPDRDKRNDALSLLSYAGELQEASAAVKERAEFFHAAGYGAFDGLHLAHAEAAAADVLLSTDDRFVKQAGRGSGNPLVLVMNPIDWLRR